MAIPRAFGRSIFLSSPKTERLSSDKIAEMIRDRKREDREEQRHQELLQSLGTINKGLPFTSHGGGILMANAKHQVPTAVEGTSNYDTLFAYDSSLQLEYIGKSNAGTATSASEWQVKQLTWAADGTLTKIEYADNNQNYDNVWDNRATLNYGP